MGGTLGSCFIWSEQIDLSCLPASIYSSPFQNKPEFLTSMDIHEDAVIVIDMVGLILMVNQVGADNGATAWEWGDECGGIDSTSG